MKLKFPLKFSYLLFALLFLTNLSAQIFVPVKWSSRVEKGSNNEVTLVMEGKIEEGWHVYSQFTPEDGPLPIVIDYKNQKGNYTLIGKTSESKTHREFNKDFGVDEVFFEEIVVLKQKIKVLNTSLAKINAAVDYQVCKDRCVNDTKDFTFDVPKMSVEKSEAPAGANSTAAVVDSTANLQESVLPDTIKKTEVKATENPGNSKSGQKKEKQSLWTIFIGTLLAGFLSTITPCVFPMIPMTVSFFIKQSGTKAKGKFNAFFYGFCIIAIYVLISLPFHIFESLNPDMFSEISTNVYLNLFFFVIFVVFAISFFGAFEITMPNWLASKADNASNSGGLFGIFFMALTLIIVSFSCTGPALGLVLGSVLSTDGGATILTIAMLGFGLGLAFPFIGLALFPGLMTNLPKSGGWLNTVKVVFGFIELALAFKFISNADLVLDTHLLEREVFLAIWIAIFGLLALYLFGKISLPHDSKQDHISVGRMLLGLVSLAFTIYMIPGLWGAPLKLISAFPPPPNYSESPEGVGATSGPSASGTKEVLPPGAVYGPHHIVSFEDYATGLAYAKKVNKPVFLDFTGKACVNCRKTENNVWSDPRVLEILKNDVVLISLFCDLRIELPENEKFISKSTGSAITNVGQKWSEFERERYQSNARPYYVLLDLNENSLNEPMAYEPDVEVYYKWLKESVSRFKK
ncbi:MAG: thiol:disulfide interchange protein [Flavobacterium sp. BFFFF1]|uniref:protein-disulfide reductase DsbD family protein n=1 Tax=Flavobacterium sp. BFFFF1 TaxID=2015557 RepID=UPI000BC7D315|nr:cytochrome c biogenesis protein CcdA [Flavobacterium sp. BFFFF1]OYU81232.1 MAG: thiol:disulfide interchange protein [Flavobacterium sp. BFFFF1]